MAIGGIYFTKKWRAETLRPGLEFDKFKPPLWIGNFKCISWQNGLFYRGDNRGFLKEGARIYLMATFLHCNAPTFFILSSHLQSMVGDGVLVGGAGAGATRPPPMPPQRPPGPPPVAPVARESSGGGGPPPGMAPIAPVSALDDDGHPPIPSLGGIPAVSGSRDRRDSQGLQFAL